MAASTSDASLNTALGGQNSDRSAESTPRSPDSDSAAPVQTTPSSFTDAWWARARSSSSASYRSTTCSSSRSRVSSSASRTATSASSAAIRFRLGVGDRRVRVSGRAPSATDVLAPCSVGRPC